MNGSNTTAGVRDRHTDVIRSSSSIVVAARWIVCATMLAGTSVHAQPPWVVDWYQDGILGHEAWNRIKINPNSGVTVLSFYDYEGPWWDEGCQSGWHLVPFATDGAFMAECCYDLCIGTWGVSQYYRRTLFPLGGNRLSLFTNTSAVPYWEVSIVGVYTPSFPGEPWGIWCSSEPSEYETAFTNAFLAEGGNVFVGGTDGNCENRLWRTTYPHPLSTGTECACLSHPIINLDLYADTLLAVGFPTVTKVDTTNMELAGAFELYTGTPADNGWTCTSADTLYWISQFDGAGLHVGKYLINAGPIWEVTLPFSAYPVELHDDGMGRLWTAVGNSIIWIDQADGSYESHPFGLTVDGMDMVGNTVAITGTTDGTTSYVLHAHITP